MFFSEAEEANLRACPRIAVMGGESVGKTCLLNQFLHHVYKDKYKVTSGVLYHRELEVDGKSIQLEIFDTPGMDCFESVRKQAIRVCNCFMLVYAVNDSKSFELTLTLLEKLREQKGEDTPVVITGTRIDLPVAEWFEKPDYLPSVKASERECNYFEVTAKRSDGISDIFVDLVRQYHRNIKQEKGKQSKFSKVKKFFERK